MYMGRIYDFIQSIGYGGLAFYGEHLQSLAIAGTRNYDWMQGNLSDFALSAQFVALGQAAFGDSKIGKALSAIAVPTTLTIHEFFPFASGERVYDVQDIAFFYAGAGLAYLTSELINSKKVKGLVHDFKSKFSSKETLEEII